MCQPNHLTDLVDVFLRPSRRIFLDLVGPSCCNGSMVEILTTEEVAELLRLSPNRVLLLARRGDIPFFRVDGRACFDGEEIDDWIKAQRQPGLIRKPSRLVNENE